MDLNQLDLKKLRAFQLVAKQGNLRLAASRFNQTVPAISSKIRRLEKDLGIALFERLPNKLILTEVGASFLHEVEAVFDRAEQALATLSARTAPAGRIVVATASDYSWFLAPRISRFLQRYPGVELDLQVHRGADAIRALVRGEIDVSVGVFPKVPKTLEREVIAETTLSLLCPAAHPLLRHGIPRLAEIARYKLIVLPRHGETRKLIEKVLAAQGVRPGSLIEVANCQTAGTFVESGLGVAIAHTLCVDQLRSDSVSQIDLGKHFGKIALSMVSRRGARSPLIGALKKELTS